MGRQCCSDVFRQLRCVKQYREALDHLQICLRGFASTPRATGQAIIAYASSNVFSVKPVFKTIQICLLVCSMPYNNDEVS